MAIWDNNDQTLTSILPEIAKTGANCARLVWLTTGSPATLDTLIGNCLKHTMIPMVELHDATGDWSKLQSLLDYWKRPDVIQVMEKYKKWVLLNIGNEVGPKTSNEDFFGYYQDAIAQLREAGYKMPLIIDAADWGKDEENITSNWQKLMNLDPQKNLMFSVHLYWKENIAEELKTRLDNLLNKVVNENIPLFFGEGPQLKGGCDRIDWPYEYTLAQCQKNEIGWVTWSWGAVVNGDCKESGVYDLTTDGKYGNWRTDFARKIMVEDKNSIQKTSVRPKSILQ
jgi:mannan endo-1,4-beta-mannosidase